VEEYLPYLEKLFTQEQWVALAIITLTVMSLVQVFKNVWFGFFPERKSRHKRAMLWLAAFTIGIGCGIAGYYVGKPLQPLWFWLFCGASTGPGAIGVFKVFFVLVPYLKQRAIAELKNRLN